MQHVASILERTTEDYETVVDEGIHEPRVLIPTVLLTQVTRPIPGAAALQMNREEHLRESQSDPLHVVFRGFRFRDRDSVNRALALRRRYEVRRAGPVPARYTRRRSLISCPGMRGDGTGR